MKELKMIFAMVILSPFAFAQNTAINFTGSNYIKTTGLQSDLQLQTFTLEAWVRPTVFSGNVNAQFENTILGNDSWNGTTLSGYVLRTGGSRKLEFVHSGGSSTSTWNSFTTSSAVLTANTWAHVAVVKNGNSSVKMYVNGVEVFSQTSSIQSINYSTIANASWKIGEHGNFGSVGGSSSDIRAFKGHIQEVKVWNTIRTTSQIMSDMAATCPSNPSGLVAYFKLEESSGASGASIAEANAKAFNATMENGTITSQTGRLIKYPIFVDSSRTSGLQNGGTWVNAFTHPQVALDKIQEFGRDIRTCHSTPQIWVAKGSYIPTKDLSNNSSPTDNKTKTFALKNGVDIYGSLAGNEALGYNMALRNFTINRSILEGKLNASDKVYTVIYNSQGQDTTAVLDGFIIQNGYANVALNVYGGGIRNENTSPTIRNCKFLNNYSLSTGGGWNQNLGNARIFSCRFENCSSSIGGAIYLNSSTTGNQILNSTIINNSALYDAAGIWNQNISLTIKNSIISNNFFNGPITSTRNGAGIFSNGKLEIDNCSFSANKGYNGGAIYLINGDFSVIDNSSFIGNEAQYNSSNTSTKGGGGAISCENSKLAAICNSVFEDNKATLGEGGALFLRNSFLVSTVVENKIHICKFINNYSKKSGGAIYSEKVKFFTRRSMFKINRGDERASCLEIMNDGSAASRIENCIFNDNISTQGLGTIHSSHFSSSSQPSLDTYNCTFVRNQGSLVSNTNGIGNIYHCINWKNSGIYSGMNTAANIISLLNPKFASSTDFHLKRCSPAVNKGSQSIYFGNPPNEDYDGTLRLLINTVDTPDAGAFENKEANVRQTWYVDQNASGFQTGVTWEDAFTSLQDALKLACENIEIANGEYKPHPTDGGVSFEITNAITLKKGNSSSTSSFTVPVLSSIASNGTQTILKIVEPGGLVSLDGISLKSGKVALLNDAAQTEMVNCTIENNIQRAVINVNNSQLTLRKANVRQNIGGGGIQNNNNCTLNIDSSFFEGNQTNDISGGGAIVNNEGTTYVKSSTFHNNHSNSWGGGIRNLYGNTRISKSIFTNNSAAVTSGSAYFTYGGISKLDNVLIKGNTGGGVYLSPSNSDSLTNCTIVQNTGQGIYLENASPKITNCIIWGNTVNDIFKSNGANPIISYSLIGQDTLHAGVGNVFGNPNFLGTNDFRMLPCSKAVNSGTSLDYTSNSKDLLGNIRIFSSSLGNQTAIDMGAIENTILSNNPSLVLNTGQSSLTEIMARSSGKVTVTAPQNTPLFIANSGTAIELNPGFSTTPNTVFRADIGCQ
ncbi:MAG: LamG-like jellyroll fold domain-containing protein [Leadbetterella sp.]